MTDLEVLSSRLLRVECQYRRTKRLAMLVVALLTAGTILAQTQPSPTPVMPELQEVRAQQFILVDADGKERASLVADRAGSVFLVLFDKNERGRANLSVSNDGPSLVFHDPDGKPRAVFGSTSLVASHVNENGVMERTPASSIVLFDRSGKLLFRTP